MHQKNILPVSSRELLAIIALGVVILLAAHIGSVGRSAHVSPEVKFADASEQGLSIVPASCPSTPDYTGQCSGSSPPPSSCYLVASPWTVTAGQPVTLSWSIGTLGDSGYPPQGAILTPPGNSVTVPSGNTVVTPAQTTTYVLSTNYGGFGAGTPCDATVTVNAAPPPPTQYPPSNPLLNVDACTVNQPFNVWLNSSDQNGGTVRYRLWYPHTSTDYFTPFVTQNVWHSETRTETSSGAKTVWAYAEDPEGNASGWVSADYSCSSSCVPSNICGSGANLNKVVNSCNPNQVIEDCTAYGAGWTCAAGACQPPAPPVIDIQVSPSIIHAGDTTQVSWSSQNVQSCSINEDNSDINDTGCANGWCGLNGSKQSSPIDKRTKYTLTCVPQGSGGSLTDTATVNVAPIFEEL